MARKILTDFTGGEVSDRLMARIDVPVYPRTCRLLENFVAHASGGADLRPGTFYCGTAAPLLVGGDCESATPPEIRNQGSVNWNATFVRDATEAFEGTYSYLFTKTVAAGTSCFAAFTDDTDADNLHGLIPGKTYKLSAWVFVPSVG
jgi:hypothetical protein